MVPAQLTAKAAGISFGKVPAGRRSMLRLVLFGPGMTSLIVSPAIIFGRGFAANVLGLPLTFGIQAEQHAWRGVGKALVEVTPFGLRESCTSYRPEVKVVLVSSTARSHGP